MDVICIHRAVPDTMADDRDIFADGGGVVKLGTNELVAKESRLVPGNQQPLRCCVAAGRDTGGEGSDDADDQRKALHLDEDLLCMLTRGLSTLRKCMGMLKKKVLSRTI